MSRVMVGVLCLLPLLGACEKFKNEPVPMQGTSVIGDWYGQQETASAQGVTRDRLLVQVSAEGYVTYHYLGCDHYDGLPAREKRLDLLNMPITRLTKEKMVLQTYPLTPKFEISLSAWPDQNDGIWTVDNVPLHTVSVAALAAPESWQCDMALQ